VKASALEPLSVRNERDVLDYLARAPYDNVFVYWLIASGRAPGPVDDVVVSRAPGGAIDGVSLFGRQIVPYADSPAAIEAFVEHARSARRPSMIVGVRPMLEAFWAGARETFRNPRATRTSQPVYALDRAHLRGSRNDAPVARATMRELDEVNANSAEMFRREIGGQAGSVPADHLERTRRLIEAGWWWRYREGERIVFQCNVGSETPHTAQLQGVWTPTDARGKGFATRGMAAICDHLLDIHPTLCLFANDFNTDALALYDRIGFYRVGEFASILF